MSKPERHQLIGNRYPAAYVGNLISSDCTSGVKTIITRRRPARSIVIREVHCSHSATTVIITTTLGRNDSRSHSESGEDECKGE